MKVLLFFLNTLIFCTAHLYAKEGLSFERTQLEARAKPEDKDISLTYYFQNNTMKKITINRFDYGCSSCQEVKLKNNKMSYLPGEKGEVRLTFSLGKFSGTVSKFVMMWTTEDPEDKPSSILEAKIIIPVLIEIKPKTLYWEHKGTVAEKILRIKVVHDEAINILEDFCSNKNFLYSLKIIEKGYLYELHVLPKSLEKRQIGIIKLKTDSKIPRYRELLVYASIRRTPIK